MAKYKRRHGKINKKDLLSKIMTVRITSEDMMVIKKIQHDMEKPVSRAAIMREALYAQYPEYFDKR